MPRRTPETIVDWLVVGIAPFLIMLLVGSLVFYLVEVFYLGDYQARLLFVLAMFVMAIVCVARISMEEGAGYASLYGIPLAICVAVALGTFVEVRGPLAVLGPTLNWFLMGITWWAAHKLTWDCTLIEGGRDFTGEGLMQTTGLDRFLSLKVSQPDSPQPEPSKPPEPAGMTNAANPNAALPVWQWWLARDDRPHAPGVWVVYFSLAALPLFGFGQWYVPADNLELRRRTFWLLVVYVAAGLALLLSTSFLSLRRYLRSRNLEMPNEMAAVWLSTGGVMVVALLIIASLLPRPIPEYSITHLAPEIKSPDLTSSRWGWGNEGAKAKPDAAQTANKGEPAKDAKQSSPDGKGSPQSGSDGKPGSGSQGDSKQSGGKSPSQQQGKSGSSPDQQSQRPNSAGNQPSKSGEQQQGENSQAQNQRDQSPPNKSGEQNSQQSENSNQPKQQPSGENKSPPPSNEAEQQPAEQPAEQTNQQQPGKPPPPTSQSISQAIGQFFAYLAHALKWLFYLLVILAVAYFGWKHREQLHAAWQQLLKELRELWARWFGQQTVVTDAVAPPVAAPPAKRFVEFPDPFTSGLAARWSLAELVRYTFAALEARGRDRSCPRAVGQTPLEYASIVGQAEPALAGEFRSLADLYGQLAFARGLHSPQATSQLQQLWQRWK
ncbi:DUF4129 domain-containing protein [Anatilimnocola sp. NA78]|uniref:DUF4129 domain-containing protein n=1 Tax=Anatilimnocola sp. NA78 TaxID=3415683 RepID=UPI003CE5A447